MRRALLDVRSSPAAYASSWTRSPSDEAILATTVSRTPCASADSLVSSPLKSTCDGPPVAVAASGFEACSVGSGAPGAVVAGVSCFGIGGAAGAGAEGTGGGGGAADAVSVDGGGGGGAWVNLAGAAGAGVGAGSGAGAGFGAGASATRGAGAALGADGCGLAAGGALA